MVARFSIFFFSTTSLEYWGIRNKKYFTDHDTPNIIQDFRDSVLVCIMHIVTAGCAKISSNILFLSIQAMQAIMGRLDENKPLENAFKRI